MKHILNRFETMERAAFFSLKAGLVAVAGGSAAFLAYVCRAQSLTECMMLEKSLPALFLSVLIVFGGGFALDGVLKEQKEKK